MMLSQRSRSSAPHLAGRAGFTMVELAIVTTLNGLVSMMALPKVRGIVDKANVRSVRVVLANTVATSRASAAQRGCRAVVHFSASAGNAWVTACPRQRPGPGTVDTVGAVQPLGAQYAVTLATTADSIEYNPNGLSRTNVTTTVRVTANATGAKDSMIVNPIGKVVR